jgi:hypothetical protein
MNNYTKKLQNELNESSDLLEPCFETVVINAKGETYFIVCEVFFEGNSIIAERDPVSLKEKKSQKTACNRLVVDDSLSLDEHLQELYSLVIDSINEGGIFTIA